jgi:hypothetical protein
LCVEDTLGTPDALKLAALHAHQLELRKKLDEGDIFLYKLLQHFLAKKIQVIWQLFRF